MDPVECPVRSLDPEVNDGPPTRGFRNANPASFYDWNDHRGRRLNQRTRRRHARRIAILPVAPLRTWEVGRSPLTWIARRRVARDTATLSRWDGGRRGDSRLLIGFGIEDAGGRGTR